MNHVPSLHFLFSFSSENWEFLNYWFSNETWDKIRREGGQQQGAGLPLALGPPRQKAHICFHPPPPTVGPLCKTASTKGPNPQKSWAWCPLTHQLLTFWFYSDMFSPGLIVTEIFLPSFIWLGEIVLEDFKDANNILQKRNMRHVNIFLCLHMSR